MEKVLEAYVTIMEYCKQHFGCVDCVFHRKDGSEKNFYSADVPCIFGTGFFPDDWD